MTTTEGEEGSQTVKTWLSRIAPSTAQTYRFHFGNFMKWLAENGGKFAATTPDELVAYQKAADNGNRYDILDLVQGWAAGKSDLRRGTKDNALNSVRSFFAHNRIGLPEDKSFKLRSEKALVPNLLTVEEIRRVVLTSNKTFRAAFMVMFAGGLDQESAVHWSNTGWANLKEQLAAGKDSVKITIPGRKGSKNVAEFSTYVGGDALDSLRNYVKSRGDGDGAIFQNQFGQPVGKSALSKYWLRKLAELGIVQRGDGVQRYGRGLHNLRDTFKSLWMQSGAANNISESMMGHVVDKLGYDRSFENEKYVTEQLRIAAPYLSILTRGEAYGQVGRDEVAALKKEIAELKAAAAAAQTKADEQDEIYQEMMKDMIRDAFAERDRLTAEKKE